MQRDLIYRRGSVWVFKAQYRDPWLVEQYGKKVERSLHTKDKNEALLRAAPMIQEHRQRLWEAENRRRMHGMKLLGTEYVYPLGETILDDGTRVIGTPQKAIHLKDGAVIKEELNTIYSITWRYDPVEGSPMRAAGTGPISRPVRPKRIKKGIDQHLLDKWIEEKKPNKYKLTEAEHAWKLFQTLNDGKLIAEARRPDAMRVVQALRDEGKKAATINKYISHLSMITKLAIMNGHLKPDQNPFKDCHQTVDDEKDIVPFTEAEMKIVRENFYRMKPDEVLLWKLLASTGMRLDEAFQFEQEEESIDGIRFVIVGSKTDSSERRVPLPDCILADLPACITRPLFPHTSSKAIGQRMRRRLRRDLGLTRDGLVLHSLRHRAKDRMRDSRDPRIETKINDAITGHGEVTVGDGYGKGEPIWKLKEAIDVIGF